ncbi:MAG: glycosyltransferase family 4 protein [Pyrinomonadaceae bacterium]
MLLPVGNKESNRVRVLVGMPTKEARGGINACEIPFIEALKRHGIEVSEEIYSYDSRPAGPARRIARVLGTARRLRRRIQDQGFDIIHLNTSFDLKAIIRDVIIVSLLSKTRATIFLKFHGSDAQLLQRDNFLLRRIIQRILARVDGVGVLSSEERDNFIRAHLTQSEIFVVKNAVDVPDVDTDNDFATHWEIDAVSPVLLFISRFIPAKGLIDVIRACRLVRDSGHNFTLVCVGDGPARREAEEEVSRADLKSTVRFVGFLDEKQASEFYVNSTMLVFPTYHDEGFSMVIFQSVAAGLPIITTRIRAAADYLQEPSNCLWVMPRNPAMLAEKIKQLLDETNLRYAMGENNRRLAAQFAPAAVASEYIDIYRQLIQQGNRQPAGD